MILMTMMKMKSVTLRKSRKLYFLFQDFDSHQRVRQNDNGRDLIEERVNQNRIRTDLYRHIDRNDKCSNNSFDEENNQELDEADDESKRITQ